MELRLAQAGDQLPILLSHLPYIAMVSFASIYLKRNMAFGISELPNAGLGLVYRPPTQVCPAGADHRLSRWGLRAIVGAATEDSKKI